MLKLLTAVSLNLSQKIEGLAEMFYLSFLAIKFAKFFKHSDFFFVKNGH